MVSECFKITFFFLKNLTGVIYRHTDLLHTSVSKIRIFKDNINATEYIHDIRWNPV